MRKPLSFNNYYETLPLDKCLAKTAINRDGSIKPGLDVETHCYLVGLAALELISRLKISSLNDLYPEGAALVAAVHDVGKISPDFQKKLYLQLKPPEELPQALQVGNPDREQEYGWHGGISQACLKKILSNSQYLAEIAGRHHGKNVFPPYDAEAEFFGGPSWQEIRYSIIESLQQRLKLSWPSITDYWQSLLISGLTTVADWIASGEPFSNLSHGESRNWEKLIKEAVDKAGFIKPKLNKGLSFEAIFGFKMNASQEALINSIGEPGIYVLEAPMGTGKTEAALYAAYKMLVKKKALGLYFALPTRLTSNKIYERVNQFITKIIDNSSKAMKVQLCHSTAWLLQTDLGEEGEPGKSWFDSSKRSILAPFGVGTIDQALMSVLNVKHGFVRTFGLAGKVVILDEVHSYDTFTGTILDELTAVLKKIKSTVIILSATLTQQKKEILLQTNCKKASYDYPLVSFVNTSNAYQEIKIQHSERRKINIQMTSDEQEAIKEALKRAQNKQQILWIENTVPDAQEVFKIISASDTVNKKEIECGLIHSRFILTDREKKEDYWTNLFGKQRAAERIKCGRILVGTQILEQSLDLDADFLITRLAPSDMLLQRIGRLWRHRSNDNYRPQGLKPEVWILSQSLQEASNDLKLLGKSRYVYAPYVLLRTLEIWEAINSITIPTDIKTIIEKTYQEREETGCWEKTRKELEEKKDTLRRFALLGISSATPTQPDVNVATRYSDEDTCTVLLLKGFCNSKDLVSLKFLDGSLEEYPTNVNKINKTDRKRKAIKLMQNIVSVANYYAPQNQDNQLVSFLEQYIYLDQEARNNFRVVLVEESSEIKDLNGNYASKDYNLFYNNKLGYYAQKLTLT